MNRSLVTDIVGNIVVQVMNGTKPNPLKSPA